MCAVFVHVLYVWQRSVCDFLPELATTCVAQSPNVSTKATRNFCLHRTFGSHGPLKGSQTLVAPSCLCVWTGSHIHSRLERQIPCLQKRWKTSTRLSIILPSVSEETSDRKFSPSEKKGNSPADDAHVCARAKWRFETLKRSLM